jgi:hypothetical protein
MSRDEVRSNDATSVILVWVLETCRAYYSFHTSAANGKSLSSARASRQVG